MIINDVLVLNRDDDDDRDDDEEYVMTIRINIAVTSNND